MIPFLPIVFLNGAFYFNVSSNCSFKVIAICCLLCILPFLPNHQVISTTTSLASVCVTIFNFIVQCKIWVAAKRRRSAITRGNHLHLLWWSEFRRRLHRCSSSYLTYLTDNTSYLSLPMIFVLLSSASLFLDAPWRAQYVAEASVAGRLTYFKRWQQYKTADHSWSTKQPLSMGCRREDYLRLPFVDDLGLRSAMQGFLTREYSSKTKSTRRQTQSS